MGDMRIRELTASMNGVDKTSGIVRFKLADDTNVDQNDPITIPSGNRDKHSYTKQLRFYCATEPSQRIDNLQAYSDGSNNFGTGVAVNASVIDDFHTNATSWDGGSDLFGYTSGAALDLDQFHTASVNATGYCGDIVKLIMTVASTAGSGSLSAETVTMSYDEI